MSKERFVEAGRITNTHGIAGELRVEVWLDSPEFFKRFRTLYIDGRAMRVLSGKIHKGMVNVRLEGIDDINAAIPLKGKTVYIDRADAKLPEGAYFLQDLIGARVVDEAGHEIGTLTEVMETPANTVYVVNGAQEHLIPAVPEFILHTDADNGVVTVHMIEGM